MHDLRRPTGPQGWPVLGSMLEARRDPLAFTLRLAREHGDVARFHLGPYRGFLVSGPDGVRHVLQTNHQNYDKQNYDYEMLRPFLGQGLLTSDGEHWLRERRLIQPAFHRQHLAGLAGSMNRSIRQLLKSWRPIAQRAEVVDVAREMSRLALEIVSNGLIGAELGRGSEPILDAFDVLNHEVARRFQSLLTVPLWLPAPRNLAARRALAVIDRALKGLLVQAESGPRKDDLLSLLIEAHAGPPHDRAGYQQIRDEVVTLILAGHETTASLLTWTWYLLAEHPDAAGAVRQEAQAVLGGGEPQPADLSELVITESVLKEALRQYPPVWIVSRRSKHEDRIQGYRIPADSVVALSPYATHRHPAHWPEPERFDPSRFMQANPDERHPFAYYPFGGGPRLCIGADLAMMEAKMVMASVVQRYRLSLVPSQQVRPEAMVTLRPKGGLQMRLQPVSG